MADSPPPPSSSTRSAAAKGFKPRANVQRKAKAETDKYLQEEAERSKARTNTPKTRGAKAGRGRGGAAAAAEKGNDGNSRVRGEVQSGGVFGAGTGEKQKKGQANASEPGVTEVFDAEGRIVEKVEEQTPAAAPEKVKPKKAAKGKEKEKTVVTEDVGAQGSADVTVPVKAVPAVEALISDDDEPDEERRDIEKIWISSDEEQDDEIDDEDDEDIIDQKGKQKSIQRPKLGGSGGLRPVRAPRTVQPIEYDEEISAKTRKQGKQPQRSKAYETIDVDEMDVDDVELVKQVPSSPELKKKGLHYKKATGKGKDVRFPTETVEERAERLRVNEDVTKLRNIFAPATPTSSRTGKRKASEDQGERLFLLQFPPITPFLVDPNAPPPPVDDDEVVEVKQETTTAAPAPQQTSTSSKLAIKKDTDAPAKSTAQSSTTEGVLTASSKQRLPSGLVGKLNVHASGKVTMDWGGTDMEVRLGTEVGFLQDAVLVDPSSEGGEEKEGGDEDEGKEGKVERRGTAYALGQVQGKMVVVPDWGKLYD